MMKKILYAFLLFGLIINLDARPIAFVNSKNEINFDTVYPQQVEKKILLHNKGDEVLRITSLSASCGCTVLSTPKDTILPNESQEILVKYNLLRTSGSKMFHLYINTNDTLHPKLDIVTKLYVYRDVEVNPSKLPSYIGLKTGDTINCKITIKNTGKDAIEIRNPSNSKPDLIKIVSFLDSTSRIEPNSEKEYTLKFEIIKDERIGAVIRIPTTSEIVPYIEYMFLSSK